MKKRSFYFVACLALVAVMIIGAIACADAASSTIDDHGRETDLVKISEAYGFTSESDGQGSDSTIVFSRNDYTVILKIVAETPAALTVKLHSDSDPIVVYVYQGTASSHQFSDEAAECYWHNIRIYMAPEEYNNFIVALESAE